MVERYCVVCREPIFECMGIVLARDFLDFCSGNRKDVRELCEIDNFKRIHLGMDMDGYLEKYVVTR